MLDGPLGGDLRGMSEHLAARELARLARVERRRALITVVDDVQLVLAGGYFTHNLLAELFEQLRSCKVQTGLDHLDAAVGNRRNLGDGEFTFHLQEEGFA